MIAVSNTSPLNYLIPIGEVALVERLHGCILAPPAVLNELGAPISPSLVQAWAASPPVWVEARSSAATSHPALDRLRAGERDAILLAREVHSDLLLIDEAAGRRAAQS